MNLRMGNQKFINVQIPLLWGTRAVVQDKKKRLSIIDLSGDKPRLEIVGDKPAPRIEYRPVTEGYEILEVGMTLYIYNPVEKLLKSVQLNLPECQISEWEIRVGINVFSGNIIMGSPVGIAVSEKGVSIGATLPPKLSKLVV